MNPKSSAIIAAVILVAAGVACFLNRRPVGPAAGGTAAPGPVAHGLDHTDAGDRRESPQGERVSPAPSSGRFQPVAAPGDATAGDPSPGPQDAARMPLPTAEQRSLWIALSAARHAVDALTGHERAMPRNHGVAYFAHNPGQRLSARFLTAGGVRLGPGGGGRGWQATLRLAGGGPAPVVTAAGNRVEARHAGGLTEWFENRPEGIEHGFTVARPQGATGLLEVSLVLDGLRAGADPGGSGGLRLLAGDGTPILGYGGLKAWDAAGTALAAEMRATAGGGGVRLAVDARGARYPVTIDPLIASLEQRLEPGITAYGDPGDELGRAVALDGDTAVVGAFGDDTAAGTDAGSTYVFVRSGTVWTEQARLTAGDGAAGDQFGRSVAIWGDTAVIGAPYHDTAGGADSGVAYVFTRSGTVWTGQAQLTAADGAASNWFGNAVAVAGDTALVAASNKYSAYVFVRDAGAWTQQAKLPKCGGSSVALEGDTAVVGAVSQAVQDPGSAFVFTRSGTAWAQQAKLTASDGAAYDSFGTSVALCGDRILIGADADDTGAGTDAGSAYVFTRSGTTWAEQAKLVAGDAAASDYFGSAVALAGDTAVVGAYGDDTAAGSNAGSARVFTFDGAAWTEQAMLVGADAAAYDWFGRALALAGESILIGVPSDNKPAVGGGGSARVFTFDGAAWVQQAELSTADGAADDRFGCAVALDGDTALIGADNDETAAGEKVGSAYVFTRSGTVWTQQAKLKAADGAAGDEFGSSAALSGDTAVVAAVGDDTAAGANAGSAHVFTRSGTDWAWQAQLIAADGAADDRFGCSVAVDGDTALVGAYGDDFGISQWVGTAYVFTRSGTSWTEQDQLRAGGWDAADYFGYCVALSGETALVGAPAPAYLTKCGRALVFTRSGTDWTQQAELTADDAAVQDNFGAAVALAGNTAVVGAPKDDTPAGTDAGSACVFTFDGAAWAQQARLTAVDGAAADEFGSAVAVAGDTALVGAHRDATPAGAYSGSAHLFARTGTAWNRQAQLTAAAGAAGNYFGISVALSGDTALVGEELGDMPEALDAGSVHVFRHLVFESYGEWAAAAGLEGPEADPQAAPHGDGVENLLKYAFNLDGSGPDVRVLAPGTGTAGLPAITLARGGPQPVLRFEWLRRKHCGLGYTPQKSTDLTHWAPLAASPDVTEIDAFWERLTVAEPCDPATTPRLFGRVEVSLPEP